MGFLKRIKDIVSGKIAKSNKLIGNHGVRICDKVNDVHSLLNGLVVGTAICSIDLLEAILFEVQDFKYKDGNIEANPFKSNIGRLNEKNSYEMFKLVAGNYLAQLLGGGYFDNVQDFVDIQQVKREFLDIYEYSDEDIKIFDELIDLGKEKDSQLSIFYRLFCYIFERAYNIKPPETPFHIMNFAMLFIHSFNEAFLPGLLDVLKQSQER
ncbi:MAG: hypothetical protein FJ134_14440 [Deltaproteobacteria bacterium]|nr:hypothetical protein [Deltaproteobacteria bacterium]